MSPIPMCENGHSVCKTCRQNLLNCPVCREQFSNMRCFLLENMTRKMRHPCKYYNRGCPKAFYLQRSEKHEDQCQHQPFKCPFQLQQRSEGSAFVGAANINIRASFNKKSYNFLLAVL
ncbi:E3 ubiquitin-protein ligase SINAT5 [Zootermopsis nevadensis]|uniref:E3 ubiquitin-protein ligase SINAT5 n=1 Tax=Zootermopsis nevadensis TaxID=136037 RepID=A0A067QFK4_ZOONE|nr:E3 ubiquitin-protein ligase SINAT5 [Zootermopsis nevadensis]